MRLQDNDGTTDIMAAFLFTSIAIIALLVVRGALYYYESFDYIHALSRWVARYREISFIEGLGTKVGNYNQPYMYLMNVFARIGVSDLYLIKTLSVLFDALLAFFVMKLVSLRTKSVNMRILAFLLAFAIPTIILNGAMWGQCDSIYSAFAVGSIYFALKGRSKAAYTFMALALSFKMQAAFVLPMFAVFVVQKKIRFKDCYIFFVVYFATLLPALFAGFPLRDLFLIYLDQSNTLLYLNLNAINVWQFFENVEFSSFKTVGLYTAGTAVLGLLYFTYVNKKKLVNTVDYIRLTFLFAVIMPFLLPQMHDRFFFLADVLALLVFLYDKRRWYVPVVAVFCSFITYAWLIMDYIYIFDYKIAVLMLTAMIFIVLRDLALSLTGANKSLSITEQ